MVITGKQLITLTGCLLFASLVCAKPLAFIEGLQLPAWVERDSIREPLRISMALQSGDQVTTGSGARVLIRLAEGSFVKLGGNAQLNLNNLQLHGETDSLFTGVMSLVKGAFRFSTTPLSLQHQRTIDMHIAAMTVGIHGTDVWGKVSDDTEQVCLIEGNISVRPGDGIPFSVATPLTCAITSGNGNTVTHSLLKAMPDQWASQTELTADKGILRVSGDWQVNLLNITDANQITNIRQRLHEAGYPAEVQPLTKDNAGRIRLVITGFTGRDEARAVSERLNGRYGLEGVWVSQTPAFNTAETTGDG